MKIFAQKMECFGLDISETSLKIAKLGESGRSLCLECFGETALPAGIIDEYKVKDQQKFSAFVKKAMTQVKGKKLKTKNVISSLPEEKSFLDLFQMPAVKAEELEQAVRFEASNHIPMAMEDVYFDFEKVETETKGKFQEILIAASPKEIADSYLTGLKLAGLKPQAMEIEGLSVARSIVKKGVFHKPQLLIDFGQNRTSFMMFSGRALRFTSTIPISSRVLTEKIAEKMKVDNKKADQIKLQEGLTGKKPVLNAMLSSLTDLASQISSHLKYYQSHSAKVQPKAKIQELEKILLCGGGANLKGLPEFLSSNLNVAVELANPWVNILEEPLNYVPELPYKESLGYATALGLALKSYEN